jgi:hypothetical protein
MQRSPLSAGFSDVLGCSRKGKWWLRVPLKFAAKRLFPLSFHRIVNPGYPHFYHFFVAADPGLLRTPTATTADRPRGLPHRQRQDRRPPRNRNIGPTTL